MANAMYSPRRATCIVGVVCSSFCLVSYAFLSPFGLVSPSSRAARNVALRRNGRCQQQQLGRIRSERKRFRLLRSAAADDEGDEPSEEADSSVATAVVDEEPSVGFGNRATRLKLKEKLIRKVATLNRGFVAQESDRVDVEEIIEMLELENPNPRPCEGFKSKMSPIAGSWRLLYTTSLDVLSLEINPAVTVGQIFQTIEADGSAIQNIIELQPPFAAVSNRILGSSVTTLTVKLESKPVSDSRIDLKFVRTEIKANSVFGRELDLPTLGVDIPSGKKLEKLLKRGQTRIREAKKKARGAAEGLKRRGREATASKVSSTDGADGDASGGAADAEPADGQEEASEEQASTEADVGSGSASGSPAMKPFFESTYVDDDLRVGRTGSGDLFVSIRIE